MSDAAGRRTLLWDLDGTLLHWRTWRIYSDATWLHWRFLAPRLGYLAAVWHSTRAYLAMLGNTSEHTNARFFVADLARRTGRTPEQIQALEDEFVAAGLDPVREYIHAIPAARGLFERLVAEGRFRMVAATNATMPRRFNEARLGWAGYDVESFDHVTGTETLSRMKQHVRFWEELLETLGATPEECVVIGNDGRKDLTAARLGIPVFIITAGHERNLGAQPDLEPDGVGDYAALEQWIRRHAG